MHSCRAAVGETALDLTSSWEKKGQWESFCLERQLLHLKRDVGHKGHTREKTQNSGLSSALQSFGTMQSQKLLSRSAGTFNVGGWDGIGRGMVGGGWSMRLISLLNKKHGVRYHSKHWKIRKAEQQPPKTSYLWILRPKRPKILSPCPHYHLLSLHSLSTFCLLSVQF